MTREEAIAVLEESKRQNEIMKDNPSTFWASHQMADGVKNAERRIAALDLALSALRPVSREQVEKVWRGCSDCARKTCVACKHFGWAPRHCVDCESQSKWAPWNFCPVCGKPMTDEAVDMVMERLEALKDV